MMYNLWNLENKYIITIPPHYWNIYMGVSATNGTLTTAKDDWCLFIVQLATIRSNLCNTFRLMGRDQL